MFTIEDPPSYPCPKCKQNSLNPLYGKTVDKQEEIIPDDQPIERLTTCILQCSHCHHKVAMIADVKDFVSENYNEVLDKPEHTVVRSLAPKFLYPPIQIIRCEKPLPLKIRKQLELSFSLYYYDKNFCAAALRKVIELILRNKRIDGENLQKKIEALKNKSVKSWFTGLQKMGNAGTHGNHIDKPIKIKDLLDGYEVLEAILDEYYYKKQSKLESKADRLSKKFSKTNKKHIQIQ